MANLALFCSGKGSNARKIIEYSKKDENINVVLLLVNNPNAGALSLGEEFKIKTTVVNKATFMDDPNSILSLLQEHKVEFIALAGFLWLVPPYLIEAFEKRILNIHPARLPKYGGKGMYGMHVHEAVKRNSEKFSGVTIHLANGEYDAGKIIFQCSCAIHQDEDAEDIAQKVLALEHQFYPPVISSYIRLNQDQLSPVRFHLQ